MKKRIVSLILIGMMATALCACSDAAPSDPAPVETPVVEEPEPAAETVTEEPEAAEEVAEEPEAEEAAEETETAEDTSVDAEAHYMEFLKGNEADANGETFWAVGEPDMEYAIYDMNGDGVDELFVRAYGLWIEDINTFKDGKIQAANAENLGSSGFTLINDKNQFVSGDTMHEGRAMYVISELGPDGKAEMVMALVSYFDEWAASGSPEFYKQENPSEDYLDNIDKFESITEDEFNSLVEEYTKENTSIKWIKLEAGDASEDAAATSGEAYKQIYKGVVDELSSAGDADQFALVYVNNDEIPELVAVSSEGSWDKDQVFLYTTDGNEAVLLASDIAPGMEGHYIGFFEKENLFIQSGGSMGENYLFYGIEDNQAKLLMSASYFMMMDADDNEVESYMVDEEDVTPDVYITALKGAIPSVGMTKIAETDSSEMVKYDVSLDDGFVALTETERIPYSSYDEIMESLK